MAARKSAGSSSGGPGPTRVAREAAKAGAELVLDKAEGLVHKAQQVVRSSGEQLHVDLIKNEWLAGYQYVVARVILTDSGTIRVDASHPQWEEVALRPIDGIDPNEQPEAFLRSLAQAIHGTYLFATEPHDDDDCPYQGVVVPIESASEHLHQAQSV